MAEQRWEIWRARGLFLLLVFVVVFFQLLPLDLQPAQWAPPDLILAFAFVWAQRRPEAVPSWGVAGVFLLTDLLFQRPPGLWALLALLALEWSKSRDRRAAETRFLLEWLTFTGVVVAMTALYRGVLALVIIDPGPLFLATSQAALTVAVYPLVVAVSHYIFGIRREAPSDPEASR